MGFAETSTRECFPAVPAVRRSGLMQRAGIQETPKRRNFQLIPSLPEVRAVLWKGGPKRARS